MESILVPISLGLNYQHHHQDLYGILEVSPILLADLNHQNHESSASLYQLGHTVCLMDIPDLFLPKDILLYFQYYLSSIVTFRIYRHYFTSSYILVLLFASPRSRQSFVTQYQGKMISSLYDVNCHFFSIQSFSLQTYYDHLLVTSSLQLSALLSPHQIVDAKELVAIVSVSASRMTLGSGSRDKPDPSATSSPPPPHSPQNTTLQRNRSLVQESCPLCLEPIAHDCPNVIILYCSHSFHLHCLVKIEGVQCPVCRYEHNNVRAHATTCLLCGYPHHQALPMSKALDSSALAVGMGLDLGSPDGVVGSRHVAPHEDVWLCLVCGFTGCGTSHANHIEEHYLDTLHTYALNVAHPHKVWDFAGSGYVHRLILQRSDEDHTSSVEVENSTSLLTSDSLDDSPLPLPPPALPRTKVTEVGGHVSTTTSAMMTSLSLTSEDRSHTSSSYMRSSVPPLDDETEERVLNDRLDQLLTQYQEVFVWRMTQSRLFYEDKLKQIWSTTSDVAADTVTSSTVLPNASANAQNLSSMENLSWMKNIKVSLIQEEQRLMKQCDVMREKISLIKREEEVSRELHRHVILNQKEWEDRVIKAKQRFQQTEKTYRDEIPKLQERVNQLMLKLDQANTNPTTLPTTNTTTPPTAYVPIPPAVMSANVSTSAAIEMKIGEECDDVTQSPTPPPNTLKKSSEKKKRK